MKISYYPTRLKAISKLTATMFSRENFITHDKSIRALELCVKVNSVLFFRVNSNLSPG